MVGGVLSLLILALLVIPALFPMYQRRGAKPGDQDDFAKVEVP